MTTTKSRKYSKPTEAEAEARKAERAARVAALEAAAEGFELDEDDRAMMRAFDALCQHYSENNALLILAQAELLGLKVKGLDDVGAFGTFKAAGRMVRKGQHASIFIWAPAGSSSADKTEDVKADAGAATTTVRRYFRVAPLFHKSQTDKIKVEEQS